MAQPSQLPALIINGDALTPALASADGAPMVVRGIDDLTVVIDGEHVRIVENVQGMDLADFGLVHVAAYPRPTASVINAIANYLDHHGVPTVNMRGIDAPAKLVQYVQLAHAGIPVPATVYSAAETLAQSYALLADRFDCPSSSRP